MAVSAFGRLCGIRPSGPQRMVPFRFYSDSYCFLLLSIASYCFLLFPITQESLQYGQAMLETRAKKPNQP